MCVCVREWVIATERQAFVDVEGCVWVCATDHQVFVEVERYVCVRQCVCMRVCVCVRDRHRRPGICGC